jgi:hypothetical protein
MPDGGGGGETYSSGQAVLMRGNVCIIECERGEFDSAHHCCSNQSHYHVHQKDARLKIAAGEWEWVKEPKSRRDGGIARIVREKYSMRGLSCFVGEALAVAVMAGNKVAVVQLSNVRVLREPARDPDVKALLRRLKREGIIVRLSKDFKSTQAFALKDLLEKVWQS